MRCGKAHKLLSLRLDEPLSAHRAADLELHLAGCPSCRLADERLESAWEALAHLERPGPAPDDWAAIEAAAADRPWLPAWLPLGVPSARAAAACVLALMAVIGGIAGVLLGRTLQPNREPPLETTVIAETLGDLPWGSPVAGLDPLIDAGLAREGHR